MSNRPSRNILLVAALAGIAALLPVHEADARGFLKLGDIKGESTDDKHGGEIDVLSFSHEVASPRDAASGLPTGKRQHRPATFKLAFSPALAEILIGLLEENKPIAAAFTSTRKTKGKQTDYYVITLEDALVSSYQIVSEDDGTNSIVLTMTYKTLEGKTMDGKVFLRKTRAAPAKKASKARPKANVR